MRVVKWGLNANKKQEIRFFLRLENISLVCQVKIRTDLRYLLINERGFILSILSFYF